MNTALPPVGFIGLGTMGKSMAINLIEAGYPLNLYNRSSESVEELAKLGGFSCDSPSQVAKRSKIIILSLPDSTAVESVTCAPKGLLDGLSADSVVIDTTSSRPESTRSLASKLQSHGVHMLDAPVSGGPKGAQDGTLSIMIGGTEETFERCKPILEVIGEKLYYVGPSGAGHTLKAVNNLLYGTLFVASCEALSLGVKAGIDPETLIDVISTSSGRNHAVNVKFKQKVLKRDFSPGFTLSLLHKDMDIALELAKAYDMQLATSEDAFQAVSEGMDEGLQTLDHSALIRRFEEALSIEIKSSTE